VESGAQAFLRDLDVAAGKGLRLFESETPIPLKLISSKILSPGVLDLVNGPGESRADATAMVRRRSPHSSNATREE
jgi:hypothetical protein